MDLWHMDINRFGASYKSPDYTLKRITENYEQYYDIHYPGEERQSGRPLKTSPIYEWHKEKGAVFGEKSGWERVNFYKYHLGDESLRPYGWAGKNWAPSVMVEHQATRASAGLFDESSFAKIIVSGRSAGDFLNFVCANNVLRGVGRTIYTQALNSRGGIESDYTVTQTGEAEFFIVTGTAFGTHDLAWLRKMAREHNYPEVQMRDVTAELACFGIWGPRSREILQSLTKEELGHKEFPFMRSREIELAQIKVRLTRITYVGELGFEIYLPIAEGLKVWEAINSAGSPMGLEPCGYKAIESLRLEKGYRAWAGEINTETSPFEAGLSFAVDMTKDNFMGKTALTNFVPKRNLVAIVVDDIRQVPLGNEPIRKDGQIIGRVKSGGQGYTIGKAIGYAYLPLEHASPGTEIEIEFFGNWRTGTIATEPLHDPNNLAIKT